MTNLKLIPSSILLLTIAIVFSRCAVERAAVQDTVYQTSEINKPTLQRSLFNFKESTISEEDIQRLLASEILIRDSMRIAILNFNSSGLQKYRGYGYFEEEYIRLQQEYQQLIREALENNSKVESVITMPQLLLGDEPNIFTLRESAVRLQADMLLVFTNKSDIYYRYKMFKKNEVKAYASSEVLLLDIRTGIIPFSEITSSETLLMKDKEQDLNDSDLRRRAEQQAILNSLSEAAQRLNEFLR